MRSNRRIELATYLLSRLNVGLDGRALAGDLREELETGRTEGWFWRQVAIALVSNALASSRVYALPLIYSAGWSLLYPGWLAIGRHGLLQSLSGASASFAWPYSALLLPVFGVLPMAAFVWIGLLVYLSSPVSSVGKLSILRLVGGLSGGLNVLLLAALALLRHTRPHGMDLHLLMVENFYSTVRWIGVGVPLMLSLYVAILCAQPPAHRGRVVID